MEGGLLAVFLRLHGDLLVLLVKDEVEALGGLQTHDAIEQLKPQLLAILVEVDNLGDVEAKIIGADPYLERVRELHLRAYHIIRVLDWVLREQASMDL